MITNMILKSAEHVKDKKIVLKNQEYAFFNNFISIILQRQRNPRKWI